MLKLTSILTVLFSSLLSSSAIAATDMWVTGDNVILRTCPDEKCGRIGTSFFREKATIMEEKDGWARITKFYDASCANGLSEYITEGNAACVASNGIENGQVAKWIPINALNSARPEDPAKNAEGDYTLIKGSDDYRLYKDIFAKTARKLIDEGKCTAADFEEMGGWLKSSSHQSSPVYFTYCKGMTVANRLYLNAATGDVFK